LRRAFTSNAKACYTKNSLIQPLQLIVLDEGFAAVKKKGPVRRLSGMDKKGAIAIAPREYPLEMSALKRALACCGCAQS